MKKQLLTLLLLTVSAFLLSFTVYKYTSPTATCTGSKSCTACKNCKYCKHCSREGGSCGVCR